MDGVSPSMSYSELCAKVGQLSIKDEPRLIGWNQKMNNFSQATEKTMLYQLSLHTMSSANKTPGYILEYYYIKITPCSYS